MLELVRGTNAVHIAVNMILRSKKQILVKDEKWFPPAFNQLLFFL